MQLALGLASAGRLLPFHLSHRLHHVLFRNAELGYLLEDFLGPDGPAVDLFCNFSWTLRILSGISEGICNTMVQSGGEFLYIGVGGR